MAHPNKMGHPYDIEDIVGTGWRNIADSWIGKKMLSSGRNSGSKNGGSSSSSSSRTKRPRGSQTPMEKMIKLRVDIALAIAVSIFGRTLGLWMLSFVALAYAVLVLARPH